MSEDIYDEGFEKITNIDVSALVIGMMREKYRDRPTMQWMVMDGMDMDSGKDHFANETMDTIIVKATLDMMTCLEAGANHIEKVKTGDDALSTT